MKFLIKKSYNQNLLFFAFIGLLININYSDIFFINTETFWDLEVYQKAVNFFNRGLNPYISLKELKFVYPPLVLFFFNLFGENLKNSFIFLYASSFCLFLRSKIGRHLFLFSLISSILFYNKFFLISILTGNITIFIHFFLIYLASINNKVKPYLFFIATLIASLIKPYFGAYILFGFLNKWNFKEKFLYLFFFCFLLFTILFAQIGIFPELFNDFIISLKSQAIGSGTGPGRDIGIGLYSIFGEIFNSRKIAIMLHFFAVILISFISFNEIILLKKSIPKKQYNEIIFLTLLTFIVFLNPRLKIYDYWIIVSTSTSLIFSFYKILSIDQKNQLKKLLILFSGLIISFFILDKLLIIKLHHTTLQYASLYLPFISAFIILPKIISKNILKSKEIN